MQAPLMANFRAIARPIPLAPPVISAVLPSSGRPPLLSVRSLTAKSPFQKMNACSSIRAARKSSDHQFSDMVQNLAEVTTIAVVAVGVEYSERINLGLHPRHIAPAST